MIDDDRGQLLLAGAVAIALALLGLTAIINVVVFTETAGGQGTHEAVLNSEQTVTELERAAATAVAAADREEVDYGTVDDTLDQQFRQRVAERTGAYVRVESINEVASGHRVNEKLPLTNDTILNASRTDDIGRMSLTLTDLSGDMTVYAGSESIQIEEDASGFLVNGCRVDNDTVHVEFARGVAWPSDCQFARFAGATDPQEVTLEGQQDVSGSITVVYMGDSDAYTGSNSPDRDHVAWTINVSYVYESDVVTREGTTEVPVYP